MGAAAIGEAIGFHGVGVVPLSLLFLFLRADDVCSSSFLARQAAAGRLAYAYIIVETRGSGTVRGRARTLARMVMQHMVNRRVTYRIHLSVINNSDGDR